MHAVNGFLRVIMRSPIVWGLLASAAFYGLIFGGPLDLPVMHRYFTHHPVEYGETLLFSVALAALLLRFADITVQRANVSRSPWKNIAAHEVPPDALCDTLQAELDGQSSIRKDEYYLGRLRAALRFIRHHGSSDGLSDELKYMADADATRSHARFGLFRVIVWAIPILGFLGTVIGITLALNAIDPKNPDESMLKVITGLGLKFDTTAVALSLSMVLMFVHFFVDRAETSLLSTVERKVEEEVAEYLPSSPSSERTARLPRRAAWRRSSWRQRSG